MTDAPQSRERRLYWFVRHSVRALRSGCAAHPRKVLSALFVAGCLLFLFRPVFHPFALSLRRHLVLVVLISLYLSVLVRILRGAGVARKGAALLLTGLLAIGLLRWGPAAYNHVALYMRYRSLTLVELNELPVTGHERIHPRNSIYSLAHEVMSESESPMVPDFVKVGGEYRWTMGVEPAYLISRIWGGVREIISVPATHPSPSFSRENRIPVHFTVGEKLKFSHSTRNATVRAFGPWRYFNYEPGNVTYFSDNKGEWVQAVSLVRWRGWFFPVPEFGGVQLIRQERASFIGSVRRVLFGIGDWIRPEEVAKHPFLQGENILGYKVSRWIAHSFRFQSGFLAPLPGYHKGDIRIPHSAADVNSQPFPAYFESEKLKGKLYHYFALEPYDPAKQGLNTSLFIPADGEPVVYAYRHHQRGESMIGVSAITAKVMETRKNYDWTQNHPVEHRPFIKRIDGKTRFFWLTTVVTFKETEKGRRFIAGSIPDLILTDAVYNRPVWVNPMEPAGWINQLRGELGPVWSAQQ